jgi:glycerophosphoryl diester phosphodiesterase
MLPVPTMTLPRIAAAILVLTLSLLYWWVVAREEPPPYESPFTREKLDRHYEPYGYVAHALGVADGEHYTNSLEAFQAAYNAGLRIFEVDLVLLADGNALAAHDNFEERYGLDKRFWELTAAQIPKKYKKKFTILFERDLLRLIAEHPDVYLILDTKARSLEEGLEIVQRLVDVAREHYPDALARLIPHVGGQRELDGLRKIYPFNDYMACLYRARLPDPAAVDFVRMNQIKAVMMWWDRRYSMALDAAMRNAGAVTYVHSLSPDQPEELEAMRRFRSVGVGVYTNGAYRAAPDS